MSSFRCCVVNSLHSVVHSLICHSLRLGAGLNLPPVNVDRVLHPLS